jgi:tetratricopeptide (TPR) repeat protein
MVAAAVLICAALSGSLDRGREFLQRGDAAVALYWLQEATREDPRNAGAWRDAGIAYGHLGRYQEAIDALVQSLTLSPDAGAYSELSRAYMAIGRWDDAAAAEEQALRRTLPAARDGWYTQIAGTVSNAASNSSQSVAFSVSERARKMAQAFKRAFWK